MRLVLDTNTVISGLLWHGAPGQLIDFAQNGQITLYTSIPLLTELQGVLHRSKFSRQFESRGLLPDDLFDGYTALATTVTATAIEPVITSDPDDDHVLACALAAGADLIVSGDTDLVTLEQYKGIPIVSPANALEHIRKTESL